MNDEDINRKLDKAWRRLHAAGDHRACTITTERRRVVVGHDHRKTYFAGPAAPDGVREMIDATSMFGDPIYEERDVNVHRYEFPL